MSRQSPSRAARRTAASSNDHFGGGAGSGHLRAVVGSEAVVKRVLAPLARQARTRGIELLCEILPNVGEVVIGDDRRFASIMARAVTRAMDMPGAHAVRVRIARQGAGFDEADMVLTSVTVGDAAPEETTHFELSLPRAQNAEVSDPPLAGTRVLIVVPSEDGHRIVSAAIRWVGGTVTAARDAMTAREHLRLARDVGAPFDIVYVDEAVGGGANAFLHALREDSTFAPPSSIVATASPHFEREMLGRDAVDAVLYKPVLPGELVGVISRLRSRASPRSDDEAGAHGVRVLLAQADSVGTRAALASLRRLGHHVVHAPTGRRALEAFVRDRCQVVLLDSGLADLGALGVARAIRKHREAGGGRTAVLVFAPSAVDEEELRRAGVDDVLAMPLDASTLPDLFALSAETPARLSVDRIVTIRRRPAIDLPALRERCGGDDAFVRELLSGFLNHCVAWGATLAETAAAGAFGQVRELAHRYRGALATLSAVSAVHAAADIEGLAAQLARAAARGGHDDRDSARRRLQDAIEELQACIDEVRGECTALIAAHGALRRTDADRERRQIDE